MLINYDLMSSFGQLLKYLPMEKYTCMVLGDDYVMLDKLQVLADKLPEVLDFSKDLASLEAASKVFLFVMMRSIIRVGTS